jgi:vancomycin permeability regulator SanA
MRRKCVYNKITLDKCCILGKKSSEIKKEMCCMSWQNTRALQDVMTSRNVRHKRRKRVRWAVLLLCALLIAGCALSGVNGYMAKAAERGIVTQEEAAQLGADCILVLGARVWPGGAPSHMLEDRLRRGVALYQDKAAPVLLVSGDHGQVEYDEVSAMKQYCVDHDVPSADIFMDHAGFSTYDSLYRARDVFGAKRVIIVTQRYHMFRALYIARQLGLEAWGVTSDYRAYATQAQNSAREALARCKDYVKCMIQPEPIFLGDPIPLNVSGDVTNDEGVAFEKRSTQQAIS